MKLFIRQEIDLEAALRAAGAAGSRRLEVVTGPLPVKGPPALTSRRATFSLPPALIKAVQRAAHATQGASMASIAESALRREIARLEAARGRPFTDNETTKGITYGKIRYRRE